MEFADEQYERFSEFRRSKQIQSSDESYLADLTKSAEIIKKKRNSREKGKTDA